MIGLPRNWTDKLLYKMFSKFGKLVHWEVKRDLTTNEPFACGHVSFESANEVNLIANYSTLTTIIF